MLGAAHKKQNQQKVNKDWIWLKAKKIRKRLYLQQACPNLEQSLKGSHTDN